MSELREAFSNELADLYDAERQLVEALPKMGEAASASELKEALDQHLEETKNQLQRLKRVFQSLGQQPKGKKCQGMQGLIAEAQQLIEEERGDAALICSAQKIEHYEIASYGSLCSWAGLLEADDAAELLAENLQEEKAADEKLTEIAESSINIEESEGEAEEP